MNLVITLNNFGQIVQTIFIQYKKKMFNFSDGQFVLLQFVDQIPFKIYRVCTLHNFRPCPRRSLATPCQCWGYNWRWKSCARRKWYVFQCIFLQIDFIFLKELTDSIKATWINLRYYQSLTCALIFKDL